MFSPAMHDGVHTLEGGRVDGPGVRIPPRLVLPFRCTANEAQHFVAARGEEWREHGADEAARASDRNLHGLLSPARRVRGKVVRRDAVAIGERSPEGAASQTPADEVAGRGGREGVFDPVLEGAGAGAFRRHPVGVLPEREWARHLAVVKLAAGHRAVVLGHPSLTRGCDTQDDAGPFVIDTARARLDNRRIPGRVEALEGPRARVPTVHVVGRRSDPRAMDEHTARHRRANR